jgi:hypothetical protein
MPTVLRSQGFRFFFYSNENDEPIHVHVEKGNGHGKVWLEPDTSVAYFHNFTAREERQIMEMIAENVNDFKVKWNEYFL